MVNSDKATCIHYLVQWVRVVNVLDYTISCYESINKLFTFVSYFSIWSSNMLSVSKNEIKSHHGRNVGDVFDVECMEL